MYLCVRGDVDSRLNIERYTLTLSKPHDIIVGDIENGLGLKNSRLQKNRVLKKNYNFCTDILGKVKFNLENKVPTTPVYESHELLKGYYIND